MKNILLAFISFNIFDVCGMFESTYGNSIYHNNEALRFQKVPCIEKRSPISFAKKGRKIKNPPISFADAGKKKHVSLSADVQQVDSADKNNHRGLRHNSFKISSEHYYDFSQIRYSHSDDQIYHWEISSLNAGRVLSACNSPFGRYWRQNFSQFFTNEDERLDDFLNGKERKYVFYRSLPANMVFYFGNLRIDKSIQGRYVSSEVGELVKILIVGQNHHCFGIFIVNQLIKTLQEYKTVRFLNSVIH